MIALLCFFLTLVASPFKSKRRLEAENAALRHQLIVLRRRVRGRVHLTSGDRLFLVQLYRWFPSVLKVITIIRPETLVRCHRTGFPPVLALEIPLAGRPTEDRRGSTRVDPADEAGVVIDSILRNRQEPVNSRACSLPDRACKCRAFRRVLRQVVPELGADRRNGLPLACPHRIGKSSARQPSAW